EPVHARHVHVADDHRQILGEIDLLRPFDPVGGLEDLVPGLSQQNAHLLAHRAGVIDHHDLLRHRILQLRNGASFRAQKRTISPSAVAHSSGTRTGPKSSAPSSTTASNQMLMLSLPVENESTEPLPRSDLVTCRCSANIVF